MPLDGAFSLKSDALAYAFAQTVCSATQRYVLKFIIRTLLAINLISPHLFLLSMLQMRFRWCLVANAHVRTLAVVELYETRNESPCIFKGRRLFPRIDALCLQYAIYTLCNGIVRRLIVLCHGDCNAVAFQHGHICITAILDTTIGMVDEVTRGTEISVNPFEMPLIPFIS